MSQDNQMTMQNPLYGVQSAHFEQAVERARGERSRLMRRLVEAVFGRRSEHDDQAEIDKASALSAEMLKYGRPF